MTTAEKNPTSDSTQAITLLIALAFVVLVSGGLWAWANSASDNKDTKPATTDQSPASTEPMPEKEGELGGYHYWVGGPKDNKYAVLFKPFLPRNDALMKVMLADAAKTAYGHEVIGMTEPTVDVRNGVGYLIFDSPDGRYVFLINKEDTGDINGASFWKE